MIAWSVALGSLRLAKGAAAQRGDASGDEDEEPPPAVVAPDAPAEREDSGAEPAGRMSPGKAPGQEPALYAHVDNNRRRPGVLQTGRVRLRARVSCGPVIG